MLLNLTTFVLLLLCSAFYLTISFNQNLMYRTGGTICRKTDKVFFHLGGWESAPSRGRTCSNEKCTMPHVQSTVCRIVPCGPDSCRNQREPRLWFRLRDFLPSLACLVCEIPLNPIPVFTQPDLCTTQPNL